MVEHQLVDINFEHSLQAKQAGMQKMIDLGIDNICPMDWKLISATVTNRVSRPLAKWLVVFGLHFYPSRFMGFKLIIYDLGIPKY